MFSQDNPRLSRKEPSPVAMSDTIPVIRSEDLLQGGRELRITHGGELYRLTVTRNNRLILQK